MTVSPAARVHAGSIRELWDGPIIDVDVHVSCSLSDLRPYLGEMWIEFMEERGLGPWAGNGPSRVMYEDLGALSRVYPPAESTTMAKWRPQGDAERVENVSFVPKAGEHGQADLPLLQEHILDGLGVDFAILNCYIGVDSMRYPDFNVALAEANNDWLIDKWLSQDSRLRASMVLPSRSPAAAAREVERVGGHPGFVQALMPVHSDRLYGKREWYPLIEALTRHDLVAGLHLGGTPEGPSTVTGTPNHYITEYTSATTLFAQQLLSLVGEGTFQEYPDLRVSVLEAGFAWFPPMSWRFDKEWKGLRRDVPWVDAPPTEILRRHARFSTAPVDCDTRDGMEAMQRWLVSDELLMFATDYPHWHDDDMSVLIGGLPVDSQRKLMAENARDWYRL